MRILIGSTMGCFRLCASYAAITGESQRGGRPLPCSERRSTPVLRQRHCLAPDFGALGVEDQCRLFRCGNPGAARDLVIELMRRPAGIAKSDQALLRSAAKTDIAQD